jgi:pimeloyl-ACP methyl ester carboxylesterase
MTAASHVLIPGAGGIAWYWHLVVDELRERGHDVVAVDLPADDDTCGLAEYAETVIAAIGDRTNVTLVAQSMAGFTAPLVCERSPVSLLVLVNAMIPAPGETAGDWWANTGQPEAKREMEVRDGRDPDADFDEVTTFLHDVPQHIIDESPSHARRQSGTPFASPSTLTAWPDVPTRVLVGRDDRLFPAEFQRSVARDRLGITADEMPGGHLVAFSHPKELADRLESYHAELRDAKP